MLAVSRLLFVRYCVAEGFFCQYKCGRIPKRIDQIPMDE